MPLYDVFSIDPPWQYKNKATGGNHKSGAAQKYLCLSLKDMMAFPMHSLGQRDAVMALWATTPFGGDPYELMKTWGFTYKTEWYWHKTIDKGTGYWTRGCVEKLLIGTRGKVKAWRSNVDNFAEWGDLDALIEARSTGHSQKPEAAIRQLEALTPDAGRRIELFATQHSAAIAGALWECYGLELGHDFRNPEFWHDVIRGPLPREAPPAPPHEQEIDTFAQMDLSNLDVDNPQEG